MLFTLGCSWFLAGIMCGALMLITGLVIGIAVSPQFMIDDLIKAIEDMRNPNSKR